MADGFARNSIRISDGVNDNEADVISQRLQTDTVLQDENGNKVIVTEDGQLHTVLKGKQDPNNSTTETLNAGIKYTGTATEVFAYATLWVMVRSDVASATDGLVIEFSGDGVNWDSNDVFTIPANKGKIFSIPIYAQYYRVQYTNGGTNQGTFRLFSQLAKTATKSSTHRIADPIIDDDDAELVKAVLTGKTPSSTYVNVNTTDDGDLSISDNSSGLAIAKGDVSGTTFIHKFGNAPDFDTADNEVNVWDGAEDNTTWEKMVYNYSSTADIQYISSTDNGDTQTIEVQGLDANYEIVTQTKDLTGQTSATLDTPLIRVFRMKNNNSVTLAGHVFCSTSTAAATGIPTTANIRAIIQPGNNQTLMAIYTIPAGKRGYMRDWYAATAGSNRTSNYRIKLLARPFGGVFQLKHVSAIADNGTSSYQHKYEEPEVFEEKTDIEMTAQMFASGATEASVSAGFDIVLIDN
jgi:hypothetical protein